MKTPFPFGRPPFKKLYKYFPWHARKDRTDAPKKVEPPRVEIPLRGFSENLNETKFIDSLGDDDLTKLNNMLAWRCFTADINGRRFGNAAWSGKRCEPQAIPDRRIVMMNEWFGLADKHVLEVGCFEGIHTIGLSLFAGKVTAVDSRIENVVKTIVRCALFGYHPTVFKYNLEDECADLDVLRADVMHHVGVLYHLKDPVRHLLNVGKYVKVGLMLDTHYSLESEVTDSYEVNGKKYEYKKYQEFGYADPFSGMYDHSKWLKIDDILGTLRESGFKMTEVIENRNERNGPRVLLKAQRS